MAQTLEPLPQPPLATKPEPITGEVGPLQAFKYRDFRMLWIGNTFSMGANWIQQTTFGWVAFELTGSGSILGAVNGVRSIPMFFLSLLGGVAADRLDRRMMMLGSQLVQVLLSFWIAIALLLHRLEVWHLFAFAISGATAMALNQPVRLSVLNDVVPKRVVPNAVALGQVGMSAMRVLGPGVAGVLLATIGGAGNFFVQAGAYVCAAGTVVMLRLPPRPTQPTRSRLSAFRDIRESLRYVAKDRRVLNLLIMGLVPPVFLWPYWNALMPIFAKEALHTGPTGLGILLSSIGVGGLLGATMVATFNRVERRGLMQCLGFLCLALSMVGFAFSPSVPIAATFLFLGGFAEGFYLTTNQTIIQLLAPDHMRGRIVSLMQISMLAFPLGSLLGGVISDFLGIRTTVIFMTGMGTVLALGFLIGAPSIRRLTLSEMTSTKNAGPVA